MVNEKRAGINWTSSQSNAPDSRNYFKTQKSIVYEYLQSNLATASMIEEATGVKQKCVTWIKCDLEKQGVLWEVKRVACQVTGRAAWYLTTNSEFKPENLQIGMFE